MVESDEYEDDLTITDDTDLWRRIPPWHLVEDQNTGTVRISKAAFEDHPNGSPMSVTLAAESLAIDRGPEVEIEGLEGFCLASVTAALARKLKQGIARRPREDNPAHAEVFGKKTDSVRKNFRKNATWVIAPENA